MSVNEVLKLPDGSLTMDEVNQLWTHVEYMILEHQPRTVLGGGFDCFAEGCDANEDNWTEHLLEILREFEFEEV